jgi:hypothetical protein
MKHLSPKHICVLLLLVLGIHTSLAVGPESFAGEWADKHYHGNSVFQLSVEQSGNGVSIFFNANRSDGGGADPEGNGKGKVSGGAVQFTWTDSFGNAGTGTIRKSGADAILSIKATHVADSRCMMYYGDNIRLKPAK